ncbi:Immunoglobulin-binding protein 1b [Eumeta japonica]|uniref:Immunoglobulin-binding protein 1b n=1 Tax=Eumeta variegata TaxID=151549 RepID=A0A4C1VWU4_EUMVA|nr:Immunoglobulin-binding protein 1b [Eumeta japonica]
MSQDIAGQSTDEETLKAIFDDGMKLFENIETSTEPTNSDAVQMNIKSAMSKFEKATNLVSLAGLFSRNESVEEIPTENLQYLLLPALLGTLSLKLCGQQRLDVINVAEIYFQDYLQRCKDYGVSDVEVPQPSESESNAENRPQTQQEKLVNMVRSREAKIKRYKEVKELKDKLADLKKATLSPNIDDETKREYFVTLLRSYANQSLDELKSMDQEKPILEYMSKHAGETQVQKRPRVTPLKPVIIARDAAQKAVFGLGYPSIPTMTIEEFYDNRVKEGLFPGPNIPHTTIDHAETEDNDEEAAHKDALNENDDPVELDRQRRMDEYKDDHRRGWGNRYNRRLSLSFNKLSEQGNRIQRLLEDFMLGPQEGNSCVKPVRDEDGPRTAIIPQLVTIEELELNSEIEWKTGTEPPTLLINGSLEVEVHRPPFDRGIGEGLAVSGR